MTRRLRQTRQSTLFSDDNLLEDVRNMPLTDSWTDRTKNDRWGPRVGEVSGVIHFSRECRLGRVSRVSDRGCTLPEKDPRRRTVVDVRYRDGDRLPRSRVSFFSLSLSFVLSFSWRDYCGITTGSRIFARVRERSRPGPRNRRTAPP